MLGEISYVLFKEKVRVYFRINEDILGFYFKHSMKAGNVELCRSKAVGIQEIHKRM